MSGMPADISIALEKIAAAVDQSQAKATSIAMANLADGMQSLVQHMRPEQQIDPRLGRGPGRTAGTTLQELLQRSPTQPNAETR